MIKIRILNPNCSEAVMRISTKNLTEKEIKEILNLLGRLSEEDYWCGEEVAYRKKILDLEIIELKGETPYHSSQEIKEELNKLPFGNKLEIEISED